MTGSASSSAVIVLIALSFTAGCDRAGSAPAKPTAGPGPSARPIPALRAKAAPVPNAAARYATDLTRAVAGERKVPFPAGVGGTGGMICSPGALSGTSPASRSFTLTLPTDMAARRYVLAVVTPERGLLEIYSPYDDDSAEAGDLIVPSQAISWSRARAQNRFAVSTDELDGLRPGRTTPEVLFLEPGPYRFALVNGIDAALLESNRTAIRVTVACSVDWAPQETRARAARP